MRANYLSCLIATFHLFWFILGVTWTRRVHNLSCCINICGVGELALAVV